jgi:ADP-ribose pyrophosphatase
LSEREDAKDLDTQASDEPAPRTWRVKGSETVADCRVFHVRKDVCEDPRNGRAHDFFVIEAPDWINVIPLTPDGHVVLIEQYRHGTGELTLEIPGGMVDEGESPRETAEREMLEETGYTAREFIALGSLHPNPAIQNNRIHTFLALDAEFKRAPVFESTEHTIVRLFPLTEVPRLIAEGRITHALVVAGFYMLVLWPGDQES